MNTPVLTTKRLRSRLRAVALRLWCRQVLRAIAAGLIHGGTVLLFAVFVLVLLPLPLGLGFAAGPWLALASALAALVYGFARALRGGLPDAKDAALALQARLPASESALATALDLRDERFQALVLRRAEDELEAALKQPAPHILHLRSLLLAPALALAAGMALALAFSLESGTVASPAGDGTQAPSTAFSVDLPTARGADDAQALADILNLQAAEQSLREAAKTMRSEAATQQQRQSALEQARDAMGETSDAELQAAAADLPELAPEAADDRESLAARFEELAAGAGHRAQQGAGETDTGREGEMIVHARDERFVPFPRVALRTQTPAAELAVQTPERRALARRAMHELEQQ